MHYHIILTQLCNSECKYCYGKSMEDFNTDLDKKFKFDFSEGTSFNADLNKLKKFLLKDKEAVVVFYGGEPLLEIEKIKEIIDLLEGTGIKFRMQTNGKLLDELSIEYLNKIDKILISLDGDKERTDHNRGEGTYNKVISNIRKIRDKDYQGEIIARMCISPEFSDIDKQVIHLVNKGFSSVHWQLDLGFYKFDYDKEKITKFVEEYNENITKLIDYWIDNMGEGVLKLYPFLAITESLLKKEKVKLRCGAGHKGYAITTSGKIVACPIMNCIVDFEAGDLESEPYKLKKFKVDCDDCSYLNLCGGRCLYWRKAKLWNKEGDDLICCTIKHLIDSLRERLPDIKQLIDEGTVSIEDFSYEKYFGPEIIP